MITKQFTDARKRRNLTLETVAKGTGLSVSFLSDIEHGRGNPTLDTLERLAAYHGLTLTLTTPAVASAAPAQPQPTAAETVDDHTPFHLRKARDLIYDGRGIAELSRIEIAMLNIIVGVEIINGQNRGENKS